MVLSARFSRTANAGHTFDSTAFTNATNTYKAAKEISDVSKTAADIAITNKAVAGIKATSVNKTSGTRATEKPSAAAANPADAVTGIGGMTNISSEATQGLVTFIDQAQPLMSQLYLEDDSRIFQNFNEEGVDHAIEKFLERPITVSALAWSTASAVGTSLFARSFPDQMWADSVNRLLKMSQFTYFRAKLHFRIAPNAMQFHAGRLWCCWSPFDAQRGAAGISANPTNFTGYQGIEIDPATQIPGELVVPFFSPMNSIDLVANQACWGTFYVLVLNQLKTASTATVVPINISYWFEDIELSMPNPALPITTGAPNAQLSVNPNVNGSQFSSSEQIRAVSQGGSETRAAVSSGVLSNALSAVSSAAGALSLIPSLTAIAQPVEWLTGVAGGVARYFGFNKPSGFRAPQPVIANEYTTNTHCDGVSLAQPLAASQDNEMATLPGLFGTDVDEMSIKYAVSRPNLLTTFSWAKTTTAGTVLNTTNVFPGASNYLGYTGTTTKGLFQPSHLSYVASMFRFWSGSIKYRLEIVSTPFHAGRVMIVYIPSYDPINQPALQSFNEFGNAYSIILDISNQSAIEFEVPYVSNTPMLLNRLDSPDFSVLRGGETAGVMFRNRIRNFSNGALQVVVLNPLVGADSVASTVDMNLWVSGGTDLVFSEPVFGNYARVYPNAKASEYANKDYDGSTLSYSLREIEEKEEQDSVETVRAVSQGFSPDSGTNDPAMAEQFNQQSVDSFIPKKKRGVADPLKLCAGEAISSLRQLIKRASPQYALNFNKWSSTAVMPPGKVFYFDPLYRGSNYLYSDAYLTNYFNSVVQVYDNPLTYVSGIFAASRGSTRYHFFVGDENTSTRVTASLSNATVMNAPPLPPWYTEDDQPVAIETSSYSQRAYNRGIGTNNMGIAHTDRPAALEVNVPQYAHIPFNVNTVPNSNAVPPPALANQNGPCMVRQFVEMRLSPYSSEASGSVSVLNPAPKVVIVNTSAGDDFSFGALIGAPQILRLTRDVALYQSNGTALLV